MTVERGEMRWRGRQRGVVLSGPDIDVTVERVRTALIDPLWVLSDAAPGRSTLVRTQRDARWGGPVRLAALRS